MSAPVLKPGVHAFCSSLREGERFYWVPEPGFRRETQAFFTFSKGDRHFFRLMTKGDIYFSLAFKKGSRTFLGLETTENLHFHENLMGVGTSFEAEKLGQGLFWGAETFLELEKGS